MLKNAHASLLAQLVGPIEEKQVVARFVFSHRLAPQKRWDETHIRSTHIYGSLCTALNTALTFDRTRHTCAVANIYERQHNPLAEKPPRTFNCRLGHLF